MNNVLTKFEPQSCTRTRVNVGDQKAPPRNFEAKLKKVCQIGLKPTGSYCSSFSALGFGTTSKIYNIIPWVEYE